MSIPRGTMQDRMDDLLDKERDMLWATDHRRTCTCGHRYNVHAKNGGPCLAADTPPDQRTGQGCQCKAWQP